MTERHAWPYARVIAHRGGGTLAPENTLAAIRVGMEHGFRAIEFDAMLSGDDTPILMHDSTLRRTALRPGAVTDFSAAELAQLDVGRWHSARFAGEPVPSLDDTLAFCRANGIWCNVEIKPTAGREPTTGRLVAEHVAQAYADVVRPAGDRQESVVPAAPLLSSFSVEALEAARRARPDLPRGWLVDRVPHDWRERLARLGGVALHANHRHLSASRVAEIKAAGTWLFCYTVNEPARARDLLAWGVDAFCTDRIDLIGPDFAAARGA
ncbi:MAG: glycerophosphodiester phosphodiesterase, partial [Burkholderiaceae bacterium]